MITDKEENTSNSGGSDSRCDSDRAADIVGTQEQLFPVGKSFGSGEGMRSKTQAGSYFIGWGTPVTPPQSLSQIGDMWCGQWAPPVFLLLQVKERSFFFQIFYLLYRSSSFSPPSVNVGNN